MKSFLTAIQFNHFAVEELHHPRNFASSKTSVSPILDVVQPLRIILGFRRRLIMFSFWPCFFVLNMFTLRQEKVFPIGSMGRTVYLSTWKPLKKSTIHVSKYQSHGSFGVPSTWRFIQVTFAIVAALQLFSKEDVLPPMMDRILENIGCCKTSRWNVFRIQRNGCSAFLGLEI